MKSAWNIVFVLVVASLIMGVIQLGIVFAIFLGLIFRTRVTIGALAFLFTLGLIDRHPSAVVAMLAPITLMAWLQRRTGTSDRKEVRPLPPPDS